MTAPIVGLRLSLAVVAGTLAALPGGLNGQEGPTGSSSGLIAPSFTAWRFKNAVPNDSFLIKQVSQLSLPVSASVRAGRITIDAGGAFAVGRVRLDDGRTFQLSGLTDLRIRGVARVIGDQLLATLAVSAPIGSTHLSGHEVDALGILGAPALGFATPVLGNGPGVTGGLVYAWRAAGWGLALGSSVELRGQYTPLEAQIAGVRTPADLRPGNTYRFSVGADRLVGRGRVSLLLESDFFGQSRLSLASAGGDPVDSHYKLGPQLSGSAVFELGVRGFRSFTVAIADRYRSKFTGFDGQKTPQSNGNVLEGSVALVTGQGRGAGLFLRAEGRLDSGLEVDNTITTAAMTAGGLSVGIVAPMGRASLQPFLRGQIGRLDTGPAASTAIGFGGGVVLMLRP